MKKTVFTLVFLFAITVAANAQNCEKPGQTTYPLLKEHMARNMMMQNMMHMMKDMLKMHQSHMKDMKTAETKEMMTEISGMTEKLDKMITDLQGMMMKEMMMLPAPDMPKIDMKQAPKKEESGKDEHGH